MMTGRCLKDLLVESRDSTIQRSLECYRVPGVLARVKRFVAGNYCNFSICPGGLSAVAVDRLST